MKRVRFTVEMPFEFVEAGLESSSENRDAKNWLCHLIVGGLVAQTLRYLCRLDEVWVKEMEIFDDEEDSDFN